MKILIATALLFGFGQVMAQQEVDIPPQTAPVPDTLNTQQPVFEEGTTMQRAMVDTSAGDLLIDTIPLTDGFYQANNLEDAVPFAYPAVNMKNIRFYKRVWRDIDLSNEENYIFATPGSSLIEAIMKGINEGKLTPYSPEDDSFKAKMTAKEGVSRFADSVLVPIFDDEGNQIDARMALNEFNPERVTKFRIKEDIFFDKQRGRLETRIIGVAPLMDISSSAELAQSVGATPAFWLYFPQLRYTLVKVDVSDPDRGLYDMSMDDLFVQRKFASTIIRESSPGMQRNLQYAETADQQVQDAQEIEDKLEAYKERLWSTPKGVNPEELEGYEASQERSTPSSSSENSNATPQQETEENIEVPATPIEESVPDSQPVTQESTPISEESTPIPN